jgi:hypothetical protein
MLIVLLFCYTVWLWVVLPRFRRACWPCLGDRSLCVLVLLYCMVVGGIATFQRCLLALSWRSKSLCSCVVILCACGWYCHVSEVPVAPVLEIEVFRWAYRCVYIAFWFEKETQKGGIEWGSEPCLGWWQW